MGGNEACELWIVFFFQAEDGIRDLVRSRGLGDVYKRQGEALSLAAVKATVTEMIEKYVPAQLAKQGNKLKAVSYTHLTLPTSDLV